MTISMLAATRWWSMIHIYKGEREIWKYRFGSAFRDNSPCRIISPRFYFSFIFVSKDIPDFFIILPDDN